MYRIPKAKFDIERALRKGYKVLIESQTTVLVQVDSSQFTKFLKSFSLSKSEVSRLSDQELSVVAEKLQQSKTRQTRSSAKSEQASQTESVESVKPPAVVKSEQKPVLERKMTSEYKIQFRAPKLKLGNAYSVDSSVNALKAARDMNLMTEPQLIYSAIVESDLSDLLSVLSSEQKKSVDTFCEYLREAYGPSLNQSVYSRFEQLKQDSSDNDHTFLAKVRNLYSSLAGRAIEEFNDADEQAVVSKFVQSIDSEPVRTELMKQFSELTVKNVAQRSRNIRNASISTRKTSTVNPVYAVQYGNRGRRFNRSSSRERKTYRSGSRGRNNSRSSSQDKNYRKRSSSRDKSVSWDSSVDQCIRCGNVGHILSECHASYKTVRDFRKSLDKEFGYF